MSEQDTTPKTPEEVLEHVKDLERKHQQKGVHLARLKMWAEVALQGLTPDQVRGFSWKEADLKDSYQSWLRTRKKVATAAFMGRATTFGMGGPPGDNAPPWVHHVRKTRDGRFEGLSLIHI